MDGDQQAARVGDDMGVGDEAVLADDEAGADPATETAGVPRARVIGNLVGDLDADDRAVDVRVVLHFPGSASHRGGEGGESDAEGKEAGHGWDASHGWQLEKGKLGAAERRVRARGISEPVTGFCSGRSQ